MRRARHRRRDLFDKAVQLTELRSKLAPLLQVLLTEAAGVQRQIESKHRDVEEAGDDQGRV